MAEEEGDVPAGDPRGGSLLLVEEEPVDRHLFERAVARSGVVMAWHHATSAREAIALLEGSAEGAFDVVLLHIRMSTGSGFEVMDWCSAHLPASRQIPVYVTLTTDLSPRDTERVATYPFVRGSVRKPFTGEQIEQIADEIIGRRSDPASRWLAT